MTDRNPPVPETGAKRALPRRTWLVAGAILTAAVLVLGSLGVVAAAPSWVGGDEHERRTYAQPAARVELRMPTGEARIVGGAAAQVERELTWAGDRPRLDESWQRDTLRADAACAEHRLLWWVRDTCGVGYTVPDDAAAEVRSDTGAVEVRDLRGDLALRSHTGAVTVEGVSGPLSAYTETGTVTGSDLRSAQVESGATDGTVELRFSAAPERVQVTSATGYVHIEVPRGDAYRVEVETTTGLAEVEVDRDPAAARVIEVTATTGSVHIGYGG